MFHVKHFLKLIIMIFTLCLCGTSNAKADAIYQSSTDYKVYIPGADTYKICSMPPNTFYPYFAYSHNVYTNFVCGNATYNFGQEIVSKNAELYTNISETKISGGNNIGQIVDYTQEFKFVSDQADTWESEFAFSSKLLCKGDITLYFYKNNSWQQVEKRNFNTYVTWGKVVPDANISGWKYVVHCKLNINFDFLIGNTYEGGYTLNQFSWQIKSSKQQEGDIQKSIEENTRNTNSILGTVKDAIDNVVSGIVNLPGKILNGLKDLFIPADFTSTLKSGLENISDSLGVFGYPIQLISDTLNTVINTSGDSLTVHVPQFTYKEHVIFPGYYKSNIFYFGNNLVFTNVNLVTPFTQFFDIFGIDCSTITIGGFIKIFMRFLTGIGLITAMVHYYNNIFGTDVDSGKEAEDDN